MAVLISLAILAVLAAWVYDCNWACDTREKQVSWWSGQGQNSARWISLSRTLGATIRWSRSST